MMKQIKNPNTFKLSTMRMKDIISQLTDIIYLQCDAKGIDIYTVLEQFTNITADELETLNIFFSHDTSN